MKRGGSYGGGQSSLGYLFGSDSNNKQKNKAAPPSPTTAYKPPYATDTDNEKPPENPSSASQDHKITNAIPNNDNNNNYPRVQGQISGNFITGRPSTKVKSAPGGDSSLGYLFGDQRP
ncbi:hypothetical protein ABFS82_01G072000 [Erythranthe guttata]|uniref:Protein SPIRAL1-like 5 n=1 Tax=Erythranthe guttata TaxID=4155 RepID=A0A022Q691_ERYGU|nr:PREDICTED: protein SPIRAL1-like 5 [Erythranthe guttata]EYU23461.1 hypothetical protein MIMGU_mgv1a020916mg [Erythranthe guttata]|eukprot:XP_012854140.1 PREDICTED: protein SPIRAL1-like 5 [Erythranthe guttata]